MRNLAKRLFGISLTLATFAIATGFTSPISLPYIPPVKEESHWSENRYPAKLGRPQPVAAAQAVSPLAASQAPLSRGAMHPIPIPAPLAAQAPTGVDPRSVFASYNWSEPAKKLGLALFYSSRVNQIEGAESKYQELLTEFKSQPESALQTLQQALEVTPRESFPMERSALLEIASSLPVEPEKVANIAINEMFRPVDENAALNDPAQGRSAYVVPLHAHMVYMNLHPDAGQAMAHSLKLLEQYPNDGMVREGVMSQFSAIYPDRAAELAAQAQAASAHRGGPAQAPPPAQAAEVSAVAPEVIPDGARGVSTF